MQPDKPGLMQWMRAAGIEEIAIRAFVRSFMFVAKGGVTTIPEDTIEPVDGLPDLASLAEFADKGREVAPKAVVIKLNGGLGTSMGLSSAKSLLPVRPGVSFLDLIARQILHQRADEGAELPLILMNSFRTREDSLAALAAYPDLAGRFPPDFLQHKVPRIDTTTLNPIEWPEDRSLEWCPPGHGDLYDALMSSNMLYELRSRGFRYAFVSNADNLGAVLDFRILGWLAAKGIPFAMEVAERTESDRKGGHLARREGQLILREIAQCEEADLESFQDFRRHHYFNTNNLWIDLDALGIKYRDSSYGLALPVIKNEKAVSETDPSSPRCYQLETAMGSAIECFEGSEAVVVPRERFAPVKTTNDLLALWSDAYQMTDDARMVPVDAEANRVRVIELDPRFFGKIADFESRFAAGAPSLVKCRRLTVEGDHRFGANVTIEGRVALVNKSDVPVEIAPGTTLSGD